MTLVHSLFKANGNCYAAEDASRSETDVGLLSLLHPAYPDARLGQRILALPQLDVVAETSETPVYGVHYGTLMAICYIITGNRAGFLSPCDLGDSDTVLDAAPPTADAIYELDDVLTQPNYYYYIYGERPRAPYPIISQFREWTFPSIQELREQPFWKGWSQTFTPTSLVINENLAASYITLRVQLRDSVCQLTGARAECGCKVSHIVPSTELEWFAEHNMLAFAKEHDRGEDWTTRGSNMCLLRGDMGHMFDAGYFVSVPKLGKVVAHFLTRHPTPACLYVHNAEYHNPDHIAGEYAFARVAWAVIPKTCDFIEFQAGRSRRKQLRGVDEGDAQDQAGPSWGSKRRIEDLDDAMIGNEESQLTAGGGLKRCSSGITQDERDESRSRLSDSTEDDALRLQKDEEFAMRNFPDVFGPFLSNNCSGDGAEASSPEFSYAHLDPERARAALNDANTLLWYPGIHRTRKKMREYIERNPQVRETSGACGVAGSNDAGASIEWYSLGYE